MQLVFRDPSKSSYVLPFSSIFQHIFWLSSKAWIFFFLVFYGITNYKHPQLTYTHTYIYTYICMYINTTISLQALPSATKASHNSYPQPLAALEQKKIKMMVLVLVCNLSQTEFGPWDHIFFLVKYATDWPSIISHHQSQNWLPEQRYHTLSTSNSDGSVIQHWLRVSRATDWTTLCHFSLRFKVSYPRSDTVQPVKLTRADKITARE